MALRIPRSGERTETRRERERDEANHGRPGNVVLNDETSSYRIPSRPAGRRARRARKASSVLAALAQLAQC